MVGRPDPDAPPAALDTGAMLGHFRVECRIGAGGMGVVYRARDEQLDRVVALKVLPWALPPGAPERRRLHHEARALSRLNHPNIATVYDFLSDDQRDVIVMEFVPGDTLSDRLEHGPMPEATVIHLGLQLAEGLAFAHDHDVIHRDVKPANLRVTAEGRLKILDFGLARIIGSEATTASAISGSGAGRPAGTLPYLAPEQIRGHAPSRLTDLYAAGVTLYELATATRPFEGDAQAVIDAILAETPPPPSARRASLSHDFDALVLRAMDKQPSRRHESAHALRSDLQRVVSRPPAPVRPGPRPTRRTMLATGALAGAGAMAWAVWPRSRVAAFAPRGWAVLADFDDQGDDARLARVVHESLAITLQQSAFVNLLPRPEVFQVLARMRRPGVLAVDEDLALEVCRRDGRQLVLAGSIARSGAAVRIVVRALTPDRTLLFAVPAEFSRPEDLFAQIDLLGHRIREHLGESRAVIQRTGESLARVTTSSFEALQRYSEAVELFDRGNPDDAADRLNAALVLDPEFAMAHHALARASDRQGRSDRALEHFDRAYALREGVTLRERHSIDGEYFGAHERYGDAEAAYAVLVGQYPDDAEAWYELAAAREANGKLSQAIDAVQRQLVLRPQSREGLELLVLQLAQHNQPAEALDAYRRARDIIGPTPRLHWGAGMAAFGAGRLDDARRELAALGTDGGFGNIGRLYLSRIDAYEGSLARAATAIATDIEHDRRQDLASAELLRRYLFARIQLLEGRTTEARAQARLILAASAETARATNLQHAGTLYAQIGDVAGTQHALGRLEAIESRSPSPFVQSCVFELRGALAALRLDWRSAIAAFEAARAAYPNVLASMSLARALQAHGQPDGAIAAWNDVLSARGRILRDGFSADWPLAHLEVGRLLLARDQKADARPHLDKFLEIWTGTDTEPLRREAEQLRERVV